jgi:predicted small secreted protein
MKKTLVGLALLASFLLTACQNKASVAGSASVSASNSPISDSAVTSVPASPSVSASASTSVAPEVNTKITKKEFVNLLSYGLVNSKVEGFYDNYQYAGNSDHYIDCFVGNSYRNYFPDSRDTYGVLDNGIFTMASLVLENGKLVYEPTRLYDYKAYGYTCAYDTYRGSLFEFMGVDYDNTLADFQAVASSFYDTLTYNETTKRYQVTLDDDNTTVVTMSFANQILVDMTLIGNVYGEAYQFFDVGDATLDIPEDCQKVLGYKTVSYYNEDGSTLFDTQYVNTGFGILDSKTYPKKAGPDTDHFSYFSKWVRLDGSAVPTSISSDISVKPVFLTAAYTDAFTQNVTTSTLAVTAKVLGQQAAKVWDLYVPESWTETTLDLSRAGFFENATYHLNSSITDIVGLQGRGYRIDLNGNTHFVIKNNLLLSADGTKVYGYTDENATSFTLPEGVTKLVDGAFERSKATQIALPSTLATIGESAFYGCYYLKNLALPNSVTSIGKDCFDRCGLTSFSWPSAIAVVPEKCFYNCRNLSSLTLPEGVTKLDTESCCMTVALKNLTLPSTLTAIGHRCL